MQPYLSNHHVSARLFTQCMPISIATSIHLLMINEGPSTAMHPLNTDVIIQTKSRLTTRVRLNIRSLANHPMTLLQRLRDCFVLDVIINDDLMAYKTSKAFFLLHSKLMPSEILTWISRPARAAAWQSAANYCFTISLSSETTSLSILIIQRTDKSNYYVAVLGWFLHHASDNNQVELKQSARLHSPQFQHSYGKGSHAIYATDLPYNKPK